MRLLRLLSFVLFISGFLLTSCVSSGKFKRTSLDYQTRVDQLSDDLQTQQDSILNLRMQLERAWGGNQMLLVTQDKLQDRLSRQQDEIDNLSGNLNNTSTKLMGELVESKKQTAAALSTRDSLRTNQQNLVKSFEKGLNKAAAAVELALESKVPSDQYRITITGGEVRLSVQEDVLFESRSVSRLAGSAEVVLRGVMDAVQADPLLKLTVIGHTDNKPNPRRGASNWEYASLRATRMAEELTNVYYLSANRVVAASQGEFGPLTSNATEEGRTTNRRIDFVLTNSVANLIRELGKL